jgi:biopolymer transport protein ExbB/TolQ
MHPSPTAPQAAPIESAEPRPTAIAAGIDRMIVWVGSPGSLVLHTLAFAACFAVALFHLVGWDTMLLVLTTVVSLEAIYLAIFIQFSVNRQAASLKEVEQDVDSIQEDVEELGENIEGIKEDVEEIQEDIDEISEDEAEEAAEETRKRKQTETLEQLTNDVKAMLKHLESLKGV